MRLCTGWKSVWGIVVVMSFLAVGCGDSSGDRAGVGVGADALDTDTSGAGERDAGDSDAQLESGGGIAVSPARLDFSQIEVGGQQKKALTIQNQSDKTLRIHEISLREEVGGAFDEVKELFTTGTGWGEEETVLEAGASLQVEVVYRPLNEQQDEGEVVIRSDDAQVPLIQVPIRTHLEAATPRLDVPARVFWAQVAPVVAGPGELPWQGEWKLVKLQNTGGAPLKLHEISIAGSTRFYFTIPQPYVVGGEPDVNDDTMSWPEALAPGESLLVRVWYRPVEETAESAELVVDSDDPNAPRRVVQLFGNQGEPCMKVDPEVWLGFGEEAYLGVETTRTITVSNCSATHLLRIFAIQLVDSASGAFELSEQSLPPGFPAEAYLIGRGSQVSFDVVFRPMADGIVEGEILVVSDAPETPEYRLRLEGRGIDSPCPTAVAVASVQGQSDATPGTEVVAPVESTIRLDASGSRTARGPITRYEWTILSKPRDSNELIQPDTFATATLFLDAIGEYKVELKVYNEDNRANCDEPMIITILAETDIDILIQIDWQTPAHPETNQGGASDVDLHYLHPNASRWNAAPWDCYYANKSPEWAPSGEYGNPKLEIDRISSGGPEIISHSRLEFVTYKVGVYYYNDHGHGPSYVTMRIFSEGVEVLTFEDKFLTDKQFWDVARIDGRTLNITPIDVVTQGFP